MLLKLKINYLIIPLLVVITGSASSYFAESGLVWYKTINLPQWTPSHGLIVFAWSVILFFSSLSLLIIWNKYFSEKQFRLIIFLFILNAVINVGWNILFFGHQQIGLAFFQALLLVSNIGLLIILIWRFCKIAACLLIPYSAWVLYATILTFNVWLIN